MVKPRRRRAERRKPVAVVYQRDGVTTRHVDIHADALSGEVDRLLGLLADVHQILTPPRLRSSHPLIVQARYLLAYAKAATGTELGDLVERKVQEIGRLNRIIAQALAVLDKMRSTFPQLDQARFKLRYGQTSKKREVGWNSFKKDRYRDSVRDPEDRDPEEVFVNEDE